ncbi:class I SAM-dependent methyltransferase [Amycolatopsis sp. A1MSW2902]|uniref:class I SAM-dependent methyltransferase n=1 Tax=Amycolatopsis sp. A1MSW2902 TaxID=687413 RepID=UPI00307F0DA3
MITVFVYDCRVDTENEIDRDMPPRREPPRDNGYRDEYTDAAAYVHVFSSTMWPAAAPGLVAALAEVGDGTLVELGAGSGLATAEILAAVPALPMVVAEPSAALRAVLLARLHDLPGGDRVTVHPVSAQRLALPDRIAAVVGMHMIGHLRPDDRRALFAGLSQRLAPGAPVVISTFPPAEAVATGPIEPMRVARGEATYEVTARAEPSGPDSVRWTSDYTTRIGDEVLETTRAEYEWWVHSPERIADELASAGLSARVEGDLVVARPPS